MLGSLERETGIEPATNSLEGCDSTTELLPPMQASRPAPHALDCRSPSTGGGGLSPGVGGEGRVRTSVATRAADLQSAAIDRSATSPKLRSWAVNLVLRPQLDASEARSLGSGSCHVLEFVYSALP